MLPITAQWLALDTFEGMVNSYLRQRNKRATLNAVLGQERRARNCGAQSIEIADRVKKAIADTRTEGCPRAIELTRRFLN